MQYAAELLQQGELKIIEISARAGYRSEAAFSRRFARYFGVSPGSMRRNAQIYDKAEAAAAPLRLVYVSCVAPLPGQSIVQQLGSGPQGSNKDEVG
jgi:hypothetical protein